MSTASNALATPWKVINELRRLVLKPFAHAWLQLHGVSYQRGIRLFGLPIIQKHRQSSLEIGQNFQMRGWQQSNPIIRTPRCLLSVRKADAYLRIGDDVGMSAAAIVAEKGITIGDRVLIGANTVIVDSDFHPLIAVDREVDSQAGSKKEIVIEDEVFVGMNCLILKGSFIGKGAVIGAGSVVSGDIPAGSIAAGNPARCLKQIDGADH